MSPRFQLPAVLWLLFVAYMSVLPGDEVPHALMQVQDLYLHFSIYLLGAWLLYAGVAHWKAGGVVSWRAVVVILLICVSFGGVLELIQAYAAINRKGDWMDFIANTAGAISGLSLARLSHFMLARYQKG